MHLHIISFQSFINPRKHPKKLEYTIQSICMIHYICTLLALIKKIFSGTAFFEWKCNSNLINWKEYEWKSLRILKLIFFLRYSSTYFKSKRQFLKTFKSEVGYNKYKSETKYSWVLGGNRNVACFKKWMEEASWTALAKDLLVYWGDYKHGR